MFKIQEIREIIKLVDASTIDEFVYEADGSKVKLKKNGGTVEVVAPKAVVAAAPVVDAGVAPVAAAAQANVQAFDPAAGVDDGTDLPF